MRGLERWKSALPSTKQFYSDMCLKVDKNKLLKVTAKKVIAKLPQKNYECNWMEMNN